MMSANKSDQPDAQSQRSPDLANAQIALNRAATKARELARKTGTAVVIFKDGKIRQEPGRTDANSGY